MNKTKLEYINNLNYDIKFLDDEIKQLKGRDIDTVSIAMMNPKNQLDKVYLFRSNHTNLFNECLIMGLESKKKTLEQEFSSYN